MTTVNNGAMNMGMEILFQHTEIISLGDLLVSTVMSRQVLAFLLVCFFVSLMFTKTNFNLQFTVHQEKPR